MPLRGAFFARGEVAGFTRARETEPHGHDGKVLGLVKGGFVHAEPFPQPLTASIIPGYTGFVHFTTGCLADDIDPRGGMHGKYGTYTVLQVGGTDGTILSLLYYVVFILRRVHTVCNAK